MTWSEHPVVYEVNTAVWLQSLSQSGSRLVRLDEVTDEDWDVITPPGIDAVWLMGVWRRSPAGLDVARSNVELMESFRQALPDLTDADVIGSPYCVRDYHVDPMFGGDDGLASAREGLAKRGIRLVLDYVPNHVAPDHPWVTEHPERFIRGSDADAGADPQAWTRVGATVLAHGRDPYFAPWPDVVQLNAFSPDLRVAATETLRSIADRCDGIRCDMAMLMTNNVFGKTWGAWSGAEPAEEFWPTVIGGLRSKHPGVVMFAEAYWGLEWDLQQQGFDYCYDKTLYDRLLDPNPEAVGQHLQADLSYQSRLLRFIENHDEPRVASRLGPEAERAVAVSIATLPGATLWHEGQFEGRHVRPPVFLRRRPDEAPDLPLAAWYLRLLATTADDSLRAGGWRLLETNGWPDNQSCRNLVAWAWAGNGSGRRHLVVVNLSGAPAQARVPLPWDDLHGKSHNFHDLLLDLDFARDGDEAVDPGLYVALDPWQFHVLRVD